MKTDNAMLLGVFIGSLMGTIITLILGDFAIDEKNRAIEAGVAEWRIDAKTGVRSFQYLTPAKPVESKP